MHVQHGDRGERTAGACRLEAEAASCRCRALRLLPWSCEYHANTSRKCASPRACERIVAGGRRRLQRRRARLMITGCMRPEGFLSDGFVVHLTVPTPNVRARRPERVSRSVPEVERRASRAASRPAGPRVGERGRRSAVRVGLYYIRLAGRSLRRIAGRRGTRRPCFRCCVTPRTSLSNLS